MGYSAEGGNIPGKGPAAPAWDGLKKTLKTTLMLARIITPVVFLLVTLEKLGLLEPVAGFFNPFMKFFGLPGEAALPLLLGFFVNVYASMGALAALSLSSREITVAAIMILTSHSLLMESPVLKVTGLSPWQSISMRMALAFLFGFLVNLGYLLSGG